MQRGSIGIVSWVREALRGAEGSGKLEEGRGNREKRDEVRGKREAGSGKREEGRREEKRGKRAREQPPLESSPPGCCADADLPVLGAGIGFGPEQVVKLRQALCED
eukprot:3411934-Rhodomonas_salina.1